MAKPKRFYGTLVVKDQDGTERGIPLKSSLLAKEIQTSMKYIEQLERQRDAMVTHIEKMNRSWLVRIGRALRMVPR